MVFHHTEVYFMVAAGMTDFVSVWAHQRRAGSPVFLDRLDALIHLTQAGAHAAQNTQTHSCLRPSQISTGHHRFLANWPVTRQRWSV